MRLTSVEEAIEHDENVVLLRSMEPSTRLSPDAVESMGVSEGLLLETMLGRYVLNRDAATIWFLIDGQRSFMDIVEQVAMIQQMPGGQVRQIVRDFLIQMSGFRLVLAPSE